ncbi:MAG: oligogalacturonate lyase family protein [Bryobacteraceae bacterium]
MDRRFFLSSLAATGFAAELDKGKSYPADWKKFADPATEFEAIRLTDPAYASFLPAYYNRPFARRGGFLIFASDRGGSLQAFRLDLKNGESKQLTQAQALNRGTLTLMPDERSIVYFDGESLRQVFLSNLRDREVYRLAEGWELGEGSSLTGDGVSVVFVERKGQISRLRLLGVARSGVSTILEGPAGMTHPMPRPRRAQILYRDGDGLSLVNFDGKQNRKLKTAAGGIGSPAWSPNGKTILYLNLPEDTRKLNGLRELTPDENVDKQVAPTSQFVHFGSNSDASVFAGASRNRNSPHILILLRQTRRELTICEHRASDAAMAIPVFSPDSQKIYFQSDKHGKPALYRVHIERFVEKTDES